MKQQDDIEVRVENLEDRPRTKIISLRGSLEALGAPLESGRHIESEMAELRCLVADLRREVAGQGHEAATEACAGSFLAAGIAPRHAFALGAEAAQNGADRAEEAGDILCQTLARRLDAKLKPPRPDRPEVVMYVGASGVGKTTTLAKVAGRTRDEERKVAVVSTDTFRVGAEAQLRTVAERLDVPFQMAISPTHLEGVVRGVRRRRVLVDTAGRSRTDRAAVEELCRYREALGQRLKVHLVLSATTKEEDLRAELRRFACLQPEALVVTRLDESARLGNVANLLLDDQAPPLAWFADGQRVPEDLAVPDPAEFAASVLGGTA